MPDNFINYAPTPEGYVNIFLRLYLDHPDANQKEAARKWLVYYAELASCFADIASTLTEQQKLILAGKLEAIKRPDSF